MAALTEDQAAVYDRQLRVWGVEVQKRLTTTRVLLAGFSRLFAEVAKNLVLAGVGSVTLQADPDSLHQLPSNFLLPDDAGDKSPLQVAAQVLSEMNPLIKVEAEASSTLRQLCEDEATLSRFDFVCCCDLSLVVAQEASSACHRAGVRFFAASVRGPIGYAFVDLQEHTYTPKVDESSAAARKGSVQPVELQYVDLRSGLATPLSKLNRRSHKLFPVLKACAAFEAKAGHQPATDDLSTVRQLASDACEADGAPESFISDDLLTSFLADASQFPPLCAVLGGVVANHVIKAISRKGCPIKNFFFYTLHDGQGVVEDMSG